jgi:hypothetical protein
MSLITPALPTFEHAQGCSRFSIMARLSQNDLLSRVLTPKISSLFLGDLHAFPSIPQPIALAQF